MDKMTENSLENFEVLVFGCGQMGSAILKGVLESEVLPTSRLIGFDRNEDALRWASDLGIMTIRVHEQRPLLPESTGLKRILVFAVKPQGVAPLIRSLGDQIRHDDYLVSIAAGVTLEVLQKAHSGHARLVRAMPNTPARVGAGVTGLYGEDGVDIEPVRQLFSSIGEVVELSQEKDFHALTAISGSGPAYVFTALEALGDAGVLLGLSRNIANQLAISMVEGAARLAREEQKRPAALREEVTSPGGTTIAALAALEEHGFRHSLIEAVRRAAKRSEEM